MQLKAYNQKHQKLIDTLVKKKSKKNHAPGIRNAQFFNSGKKRYTAAY